MSHFAKIESGIVTTVIVVEQDIVDTYDGTWVQTSYNTRGNVHYGQDGEPDGGVALRKNYAGIGYTYDSVRDAFYTPKLYASWALNESTCLWESPVAMPDDDKRYTWNESSLQWEEI
jgi:hypothetical protein